MSTADSYDGRQAAERTVDDFDAMYEGAPPWDIGRPQPAIVQVADAGGLFGRVVDIGCGTGEHALLAASRGLDATGVDASPRAIAKAREKAEERRLSARFLVGDALRLDELGEQFDTVVDSGLFHVFDDDRRARYVDSLAAVLAPGGRIVMLCFSDRQPGDWGPRRVRRDEIIDSFGDGWKVESVEPVRMDVTLVSEGVEAWLAQIVRT